MSTTEQASADVAASANASTAVADDANIENKDGDVDKKKEYTADELEEYVKIQTREIADKQDASKLAFKREDKGATDDVERELVIYVDLQLE